jgi:transcriptional regulator with XRE-family HTH domain
MLNEHEIIIRMGLKIKELREKAGLSQEELAFITGVHRTYIGMLERAEKNMTITTIIKICNALGISLADFMSEFTDKSEGKVSLLRSLREGYGK